MRDYKRFKIYHDAFSLTKEIYTITQNWPAHELYNLTIQIRRSANSVNSNICEGLSRESDADCRRFIYNAYASLRETENHLQMAYELGYVEKETYEATSKRMDTLSRMINNFIKRLTANRSSLTANLPNKSI